jgi:alkylhydroperoxidase family enzyme
MPYRIDVPDGTPAPVHIQNNLGTPALIAARHAIFNTIYTAPETTLTVREREAMRFPLTVVIGCEVCNSLRMWRDWPGYQADPIPEEFYNAAAARDLSWPGFSARERVLIRFVEQFDTQIDTMNADDALWEEMSANFSEQEIGDIIIMAGAWLGTGRGLKALGVGSVCALPQPKLQPAATAAV